MEIRGAAGSGDEISLRRFSMDVYKICRVSRLEKS